jgi:hypothetical protein
MPRDQFVASNHPVTASGGGAYVVGPGKPINTDRFSASAPMCGGCMGTTGPGEIDLRRGQIFLWAGFSDRPSATWCALRPCCWMLGIDQPFARLGGLMGGMQVCVSASYPDRVYPPCRSHGGTIRRRTSPSRSGPLGNHGRSRLKRRLRAGGRQAFSGYGRPHGRPHHHLSSAAL